MLQKKGNQLLSKPHKRSAFRKLLGKEFYILRRKFRWFTSNNKWAILDKQHVNLINKVIQHQSILLRQLKSVDMYLQQNKIINLKLSIARINGIIIKPGESFSFWKLVGRPTVHKGYLEGLTIENGAIKKGTGGGLCQMGNLIYWMLLHTSLTVTERWRHGYDVFPDADRKLPFGSGATLSYNYIDLQFVNETSQSYQLHLWLDETHLNGQFTSEKEEAFQYDIFETDHCFQQQWWGGYSRHNKIWKRKINKLSGLEEKILVAENQAIMMYEPLIESGR